MEVEGGTCRLGQLLEHVGKGVAVGRAEKLWRWKVTRSKAAAGRRLQIELDGVIQSDVAVVAVNVHHPGNIEEKKRKSVHQW